MEHEKLVEELRGLLQPEYMNIEQAAEFTTFSVSTLYTYVNQGKIPFIKREGKLIFKRSALAKWLDEGANSSPKHDLELLKRSKVNLRIY